MEEERYTRITLRIPRNLHEKLQYEADISSKSMNAEIIARLEQSFSIDFYKAKLPLSDERIDSAAKTIIDKIQSILSEKRD